MNDKLIAIIKNFKLAGNIISIKVFGSGHINQTYLITTDKDEYILQKINNYAFKDVDMLMNNIKVVTSFIKNKGFETIDVIPTVNNELYVRSGDEYYRTYRFIKNSKCYETVGEDLNLAAAAGDAFGKLHHLLNDLNPHYLGETIPNFHNTDQRYRDFSIAYIHSPMDKREKARKEIRYILDHNKSYSTIIKGMKSGEIRNHIIHNDPKINNVLFDENTNEFRCVIDLDTVMPGSVLFDIGDAFRSLFTGDNEDNPDLSLQKINLSIFKAYISAYLKEMIDDLTPREIELIPYSIYMMTIECGMRFLEDYLKGNVYFHVDYEEHNLVRAKTQIALAQDVLNNLPKLNSVVRQIVEELKHE